MANFWLLQHGHDYEDGSTLGLYRSKDKAVAIAQAAADATDRADHDQDVARERESVARLKAEIIIWGEDYVRPRDPNEWVASTRAFDQEEQPDPSLGEQLKVAQSRARRRWKPVEPWVDDEDGEIVWNTAGEWWSVERVVPQ